MNEDKLKAKGHTNPRSGQHLMHAYIRITRAVAAVDSCFAWVGVCVPLALSLSYNELSLPG